MILIESNIESNKMEKKDYLLMYNMESFYWYWLGKKDLLIKLFNKYTKYNKKNKNLKILDIGCGTGSILESLKGKGELYGIDVSDFALKMCSMRGNFKLKKMDAEHLKFQNESFDVIILSDIIEHVDKDKKVIRQCYNIIKKNGIVIVTVPAHKSLWNDDDIRLKHKRRYSKKMLIDIASPFKIKKISYIYFFMYPLVMLARFAEIFIDRKKGTVELRMKKKLQSGSLFDVLLNWFLFKINRIENSLLMKMNFPNGVGLMMILEKR